MSDPDLHFSVLGSNFSLACRTKHFRELAAQNYSACLTEVPTLPPFFSLDSDPGGRLTLTSISSGVIWDSRTNAGGDDYHFLYALEKELTLELQRLHSQLYFVHAAVVERDGRCLLIAAESGTGKSTLTFALQSRGWRYLSDELAPIDISQCSVWPYRHALCLKSLPPEPYALLPPHIATDRTLHVPANRLNSVTSDEPQPLGGLVFLQRDQDTRAPSIREINTAEATTRLYGNTLNALAHPNAGLDTAAKIAGSIPAWHLEVGDLDLSCELLEAVDF